MKIKTNVYNAYLREYKKLQERKNSPMLESKIIEACTYARKFDCVLCIDAPDDDSDRWLIDMKSEGGIDEDVPDVSASDQNLYQALEKFIDKCKSADEDDDDSDDDLDEDSDDED